MPEASATTIPRDEDGFLSADFVRAASEAVGEGDVGALRELLDDLHEADLADLIETLRSDERLRLIGMLGSGFDGAFLSELDESVRDELLTALSPRAVASAVGRMRVEDAAHVLEDLDDESRERILGYASRDDREDIRRSLDYPPDSAGRIMRDEWVAFPEDWNVGRAIDRLRSSARDYPKDFLEVFVVDAEGCFRGSIPSGRLLVSPRPRRLGDIADRDPMVFRADDDQESVALAFEKYHLISAAALDSEGKVAGRLVIDDIVEVIRDEVEEDFGRLAGVGDESVSDSPMDAIRGRAPWLAVNLASAALASWVISFFDAAIEKVVALAILMPIVASMGGNAGTQAMSVAVRAIASRDLGTANARTAVVKETLVGSVNGAIFAVAAGLGAMFWFGDVALAVLLGAAMVLTLASAALSGVLIPLGLARARIDPAVASSVFVTTVTDVVGFLAFLGLAAWWFAN